MNRLKNLEFEYNGNHYELGFTINEVKEFATYSRKRSGRVKDTDFLKIALRKYSKVGYLTDKMVEEVNEVLYNGIETPELGYMNYTELFQYLIDLYIQAIDEEASKVAPAVIKIEKDNTVSVTVDEETYKLMFTREIIQDGLQSDIFDFNNILELYIMGSTLIRTSLEHYNKHFSVNLHDHIFLSIWATKFEESTEDNLAEVLHALTYHMKDVLESGIKKSKPPIKATVK